METTSENLSFVPLRNHPEFLEETATLLNSQWSRSLNGRLHYLAEGKDDLPCSLILLQKDDKAQTRVIGHSRLNKVLGKPKASFLTCVIIEKAQRGCGLGKKLMQFTETYASSQLGCTAIYLSTFEKYEFYKHVGYHGCSQVTPIKADTSMFTNAQLKLLGEQCGEKEAAIDDQGEDDFANCSPENSVTENQKARDEMSPCEDKKILHKQQLNTVDNESGRQKEMCCSSSSLLQLTETVKLTPLQQRPPPPPPPLPSLQPPPSPIRSIVAKSSWMMKEMTS